ncbi:MAG: hypothetical protein HY653_03395 [Acidobacteria bacterium]|nr:hypothetical protein [Acidobacteriota bacterium]
MEESKAHVAEKEPNKPIIHRVCESCNNMFATHAGEEERRCPKCRKE